MGGPPNPPTPPWGANPEQLVQRLGALHDAFVDTGVADPSLRPVVSESWRRSMDSGIDPNRSLARVGLDTGDLTTARSVHALSLAMPAIRRLLVDPAAETGLLVAVGDADGRLLWVEGELALRCAAEAMHFVPGADWSEASAGTNAPGTALALGSPVQILGPEHLLRPLAPWSCTASPIRHPDSGAVLGVLNVAGGPEVIGRQTLALVRAAVAAVEAELRLAWLLDPQRVPNLDAPPRLEVLGRRTATLVDGAASTELSLRRSEIALLLALAPDGLSAAELAIELSDDDQALVTVRAELHRLRTQLPPGRLVSRPYRLPGVGSDVAEVGADLDAGRLAAAVAGYRGPVLPASDAPGVARIRDDLHRRLRGRLLAGGSAEALLAFASSPFGRDDLELWARLSAILPASSPRRREVIGHARALDRALR